MVGLVFGGQVTETVLVVFRAELILEYGPNCKVH